MEVTENIHGINVTFWKTHVGHENDLAHLVLSKEDKAKIMGWYIINNFQFLIFVYVKYKKFIFFRLHGFRNFLG